MEAMSFHGDWLFRGSVSLWRLPQLNPVPFRISDPGKPAIIIFLDVLHFDGNDLIRTPLDERRRVLSRIVKDTPVLVSDPLPGTPAMPMRR